jgi:hypothetical protein
VVNGLRGNETESRKTTVDAIREVQTRKDDELGDGGFHGET